MPGAADSLNVSQAGAILMFMLSKGFRPLTECLYGVNCLNREVFE